MFGVDYAFSHPSIAALRKAGVKFVVRYTTNIASNDANGKNLIPSEFKALRAGGIQIVMVVEYYAKRMLEGQARGREDAQNADAVVKALGMHGLPLYFAADWNATPEDQAGINAYLDGAASAIGRARVGLYGGYWPCLRASKAGKARYFWQTYAWSGDNLPGNKNDAGGFKRNLFQHRNGVSLGGASVDFDKSLEADFGQWPRPKADKPKPPPVVPPPPPVVYPEPVPPVVPPVPPVPPSPVDPLPVPPVEPGKPFRQISDGKRSLMQVAKDRDTTAANLVALSMDNLDDENQKKFAEYLNWPGRNHVMHPGLIYYTERP